MQETACGLGALRYLAARGARPSSTTARAEVRQSFYLRTTLQQVQGCGVVHQSLAIEEYDVAQYEADVEYLKVVAYFTFCAVGPLKSITMVVARWPWVNSQRQAPQVTLLVPKTATQSFHTPFFPLSSLTTHVCAPAWEQNRHVSGVLKSKRGTRPD